LVVRLLYGIRRIAARTLGRPVGVGRWSSFDIVLIELVSRLVHGQPVCSGRSFSLDTIDGRDDELGLASHERDAQQTGFVTSGGIEVVEFQVRLDGWNPSDQREVPDHLFVPSDLYDFDRESMWRADLLGARSRCSDCVQAGSPECQRARAGTAEVDRLSVHAQFQGHRSIALMRRRDHLRPEVGADRMAGATYEIVL